MCRAFLKGICRVNSMAPYRAEIHAAWQHASWRLRRLASIIRKGRHEGASSNKKPAAIPDMQQRYLECVQTAVSLDTNMAIHRTTTPRNAAHLGLPQAKAGCWSWLPAAVPSVGPGA